MGSLFCPIDLFVPVPESTGDIREPGTSAGPPWLAVMAQKGFALPQWPQLSYRRV